MATRRYTIQSGDTIHQVARRLLNHADQWIVLAEFNALEWPYVDTSGVTYPDKRVLVVGDTLLVPDGLSGPDVQRVSPDLSPDPYTVLLGVDLELNNNGDLVGNPATRDWQTVSAVANLQQALLHRILTRRGELAYHPTYGSNLDEHIGQPLDQARVSLIRLDIIQTMLADPRIRAIPALDVVNEADHLDIRVSAEVIGVDDVVPLNLVIPR